MMSGMIQDKNVDNIIQTIEVFINNLASLLGVFHGYNGGDFCAGMIFGSNGAAMLTQIAATATEVIIAPRNTHSGGFKFGF